MSFTRSNAMIVSSTVEEEIIMCDEITGEKTIVKKNVTKRRRVKFENFPIKEMILLSGGTYNDLCDYIDRVHHYMNVHNITLPEHKELWSEGRSHYAYFLGGLKESYHNVGSDHITAHPVSYIRYIPESEFPRMIDLINRMVKVCTMEKTFASYDTLPRYVIDNTHHEIVDFDGNNREKYDGYTDEKYCHNINGDHVVISHKAISERRANQYNQHAVNQILDAILGE